MKLGLFFLLCLCFQLAVLLSPGHESHIHVKELNSTNFDQETSKGKWLLKFHLLTSGHCASLQPEFEEFAEQLEVRNIPMMIGEVDCKVEKAICEHYDVHWYPTLFYTRGEGKIHTRLDEAPKAENFLRFAQRATGPPVSRYSSQETLEIYSIFKSKLQQKDNVDSFRMPTPSFILYLPTPDQQLEELFTKVAEIYQDTNQFAITNDPSAFRGIPEFSLFTPKAPQLIMLRDSMTPEVYEGPFEYQALVDWLWPRRFALFNQMDPNNFHTVTHNGKLTFVAAVDIWHDKNAPRYLSWIRDAAIFNQKRNFTFVWADSHQYQAWLNNYGVRNPPDFFVIDVHEGCHFHSDLKPGEFPAPSRVGVWLTDVEEGNVPRSHQHAFVGGFVKDHPLLTASFVTFSIVGTWAVCVYSAPVGEAAAPSSSSPTMRRKQKIKAD